MSKILSIILDSWNNIYSLSFDAVDKFCVYLLLNYLSSIYFTATSYNFPLYMYYSTVYTNSPSEKMSYSWTICECYAKCWNAIFLMKLSSADGKFFKVDFKYLFRQNIAFVFLSMHKNTSLNVPLPNCFIILNLFNDFLFAIKLGRWIGDF